MFIFLSPRIVPVAAVEDGEKFSRFAFFVGALPKGIVVSNSPTLLCPPLITV